MKKVTRLIALYLLCSYLFIMPMSLVFADDSEFEVLSDEVIEIEENNPVLTIEEPTQQVEMTEDAAISEEEPVIELSEQAKQTYKDYDVEVKAAIDGAAAYIAQAGVQSEWEAIGFSKAGKAIPASYVAKFDEYLQDQVISKSGHGRMKITDVERLILAAVAIGRNPLNIDGQGFNLIDKIYNNEKARNGEDSLTFQGNNGIIFALIALDAKNFNVPEDAHWTREKIVAELLSFQKTDGSWSLTTSTLGNSSVDITAMALISLAPYAAKPEVKTAIDKAINYLSTAQGATGGFNEAFVGGISSEATSQVIIGLTANGMDPRSEMFTKNGVNLIDHLLSFKAEDGGFKHTTGDTTSNQMATEQALQALVAFDLYVNDGGRLYDFTNEVENPVDIPDIDVTEDIIVVTPPKQVESQKEVAGTNRLPNTSTNMYNLLAVSIGFIFIGSLLLIKRRKLEQ